MLLLLLLRCDATMDAILGGARTGCGGERRLRMSWPRTDGHQMPTGWPVFRLNSVPLIGSKSVPSLERVERVTGCDVGGSLFDIA